MSSLFQDTFSLPTGDVVEGETPEIPIVLEGVSSHIFDMLLLSAGYGRFVQHL
jgi:hypothetical protein